jgi:hypothetical protein
VKRAVEAGGAPEEAVGISSPIVNRLNISLGRISVAPLRFA